MKQPPANFRKKHRWFRRVLLAGVLSFYLLLPDCGFALDPAKDVLQYNYQAWSRQSGLPANGINAITQTKAGYLWLLCSGLAFAALIGIYLQRVQHLKLKQQALQKNRNLLEAEVLNRTAELARSQALYHSLVDQMPAGVFRKDAEGRYVFVNSWFCRIKGATPDQILGKTPKDLADFELGVQNTKHQQEIPFMFLGASHHELIMQTGRQIEVDEEYPGVDGKMVHLHVVKSPVFDPDGKIIGTQGMLFDVTEQKHAEAELSHERYLLRMLLDNSPDHIYFKDAQSHFIKTSKAQASQFGVASPDELVGKSDFDFFTEEHARAAFEDEQEIIRTGQPMIGKVEKEALKDGQVTWALTSKMPLRNKDGQIIGTFGISKDITAIKQAENTLRESEERFRSYFELGLIGMAITSPAKGWIEVNDQLCQMFGYERSELLHTDWTALTHPDDLAADLAHFNRVVAGEIDGYSMNKRFIRKDGRVIDTTIAAKCLRHADGSVDYFVLLVQDITERKRSEEALIESHGLYHSLVEQLPANVWQKDAEGRYIFVNSKFCRSKGRPADEILGQTASAINLKEEADQANKEHESIMRTGKSIEREESHTQPDGTTHSFQVMKSPVFAADGRITGSQGIQFDITERKRLEAQLVQSQKMETVGKLAGGIAHEFNSILTAILGQSELLLGDLPAGSPLAKNATEISKAAGRAATLTRQLLAYGRKQFLQPEALDLNRVIASMEGVFHHLMGGDVETHIIPALDLHAVRADAGQIEQVIMNMAINAHDAMPNGGKLTLETANVSFDRESMGRYPELKPGDYVMLAITDTGTGMSEGVKARVFEPFFSTKDVGQGTGLGLSTCYGIIKQSGGHISVYSELGRGTTFKIYLPQVELQANISIPRLDSPDLPGGSETILLVEDDPALREMAATLLRRLGYAVFAAANGVEALSLKHERSTGHIDLLFTDVVMPHMSGKELADRVRALYPQTKILFTSAYTENAIVHQGVLDKGVALLQKPFSPSALAHKVREILDKRET